MRPGVPAESGPRERDDMRLKLPTLMHCSPAKDWQGFIRSANTHEEKKLPPGKSLMEALMERRASMSIGYRS